MFITSYIGIIDHVKARLYFQLVIYIDFFLI